MVRPDFPLSRLPRLWGQGQERNRGRTHSAALLTGKGAYVELGVPTPFDRRLSRHVAGLTQALAEAGEAVDVLTPWVPGTPTFSQNGLLRIHRVRVETEEKDDFLDWVFHFNTALAAYGGDLLREEPEIDLIHAHDWLVAYAAVSLKQNHRIPLLVTIHATEYGRNRGIFTPLQERIHHLEWWLTYEAWRVMLASGQFMKKEIRKIFQVPEDKIDVIPNGIDVERFQKKRSFPEGIRRRLAPEGEKLIFLSGAWFPKRCPDPD